MHAIHVTVTVEPGHEQEGLEELRKNVVPQVRKFPRALGGYWLRPDSDNKGTSILLFETEEAARSAAAMAPNAPTPPFVTFDKVEVREVVAHF